MILCLGTTPAVQRVMLFERLTLDEVNRAAATLEGPAGKSLNVAKVLHALDTPVLAIGFAGGDRGAFLEASLAARGIPNDLLPVPSPTRLCVTVIDRSTGTVTELVEESAPVPAEAYEALLEIARQRLPGCRALILSGTLTPNGPEDFYQRCVRLAADPVVLSVVDAKGPPLMAALEARPGLVKPNRAELALTVGRPLPDEAAVWTAMRVLHERGARRVVVTAGRAPTLAFDGTRQWRIVNPPIHALNPIGSGDASTAAITWRLIEGDDLGTACRWGAAAGAANALTPMAGEVTCGDVRQLAAQVEVEAL